MIDLTPAENWADNRMPYEITLTRRQIAVEAFTAGALSKGNVGLELLQKQIRTKDRKIEYLESQIQFLNTALRENALASEAQGQYVSPRPSPLDRLRSYFRRFDTFPPPS